MPALLVLLAALSALVAPGWAEAHDVDEEMSRTRWLGETRRDCGVQGSNTTARVNVVNGWERAVLVRVRSSEKAPRDEWRICDRDVPSYMDQVSGGLPSVSFWFGVTEEFQVLDVKVDSTGIGGDWLAVNDYRANVTMDVRGNGTSKYLQVTPSCVLNADCHAEQSQGICAQGACFCAHGWSGPSCAERLPTCEPDGQVIPGLTGVHFDIEPSPSVFPKAGGGTDYERFGLEYLTLIHGLRSTLHCSGLRLAVDNQKQYQPFGNDEGIQITVAGVRMPLAFFLLAAVDETVIMSYRTHADPPDGIVDIGEYTMDKASIFNTSALLAVETVSPGKSVPTKITFNGWTDAAMEDVLADAAAQMAPYDAFSGIAIHDYTHYRNLTANSAAPPSPYGAAYRRALWVWKPAVARDADDRKDFFEWAVKWGIGVVYLESQVLLADEQKELREFIAEAHKHDMETQLLFGDPSWARNENHHIALALAELAVTFSQSTADDDKGGLGIGTIVAIASGAAVFLGVALFAGQTAQRRKREEAEQRAKAPEPQSGILTQDVRYQTIE